MCLFQTEFYISIFHIYICMYVNYINRISWMLPASHTISTSAHVFWIKWPPQDSMLIMMSLLHIKCYDIHIKIPKKKNSKWSCLTYNSSNESLHPRHFLLTQLADPCYVPPQYVYKPQSLTYYTLSVQTTSSQYVYKSQSFTTSSYI